MFTVIKLGGCNGSGKTSVAKAMIERINADEHAVLLDSGKESKIYVAPRVDGAGDVRILGKYDTACGGMDSISNKHDRLTLVKSMVKKNSIVFFEGLITGKTYGALGALSEQHYKRKVGRWLYAFMDTPFDVCAARVLQRRQAAGNLNPFDPERTMRSTFNSCQHLAEKLTGERVGRTPVPTYHSVMMLDHMRKPATLAKQLLNRALEIQHEGF